MSKALNVYQILYKTLERRWGWSIYSLRHEGVSGEGYKAKGPRLRTGRAVVPDLGR